MPKFAKSNNSKKSITTFFLLFLTRLSTYYPQSADKLWSSSCNSFWGILTTSFQCQNLQKGNNFKFSPGLLLIIFCQLTMFEAASYNNFLDILITSFQCPNLQRAITGKNKITFFKILTRLSTHYLLSADQVWSYLLYSFWEILIKSFQCQNLQRAITKKIY